MIRIFKPIFIGLLLYLTSACRDSNNDSQTSYDDPVIYSLNYGHSVVIHGSRLELGENFNQLSRLYQQPKRLLEDELLYNYGDEIIARYADNNNNNELDKDDPLIALRVSKPAIIRSSDNIGIGSPAADISAKLGNGRKITDELFYFTKGVSFSFDNDNTVQEVTIFFPTPFEPIIALRDLWGLNDLTRAMVRLYLGSADESISIFDNQGTKFFTDRYFFMGTAFYGREAHNNSSFINTIEMNQPLIFSDAPVWDSCSDDLLEFLGPPQKISENFPQLGKNVLIYTIGTNELAFSYNDNRLEKVILTFGN